VASGGGANIRSSKMFAFTLVCTNPPCAAAIEVFALSPRHDVTDCPFCGVPLLDVSFLDPEGCPEEGGERVQVLVRSGPRG
jgi:hypothetical protein